MALGVTLNKLSHPPLSRWQSPEDQSRVECRRLRGFYEIRQTNLAYSFQRHLWRDQPIQPDQLANEMNAVGYDPKHCEQVRGCCRDAILYKRSSDGLPRTRILRCKHRVCPFCQTGRQMTRLNKIQRKLDANQHPIWLCTFTQPTAAEESLIQSVRRLQKAIRAFLRHPVFKAEIDGGFYAIECKPSSLMPGAWHTHVHMVLAAPAVWKRRLIDAWVACCPYSLASNQDIQLCSDPRRAAHYAAKYITKPYDESVFEDHDSVRAMLEMFKRQFRTCAFVGGWRKEVKQEAHEKVGAIARMSGWDVLGNLSVILDLAERGDAAFQRLLKEFGLCTAPLLTLQPTQPFVPSPATSQPLLFHPPWTS